MRTRRRASAVEVTITLRIGDRTKTVINSWIAIDRVKSRHLEIHRKLDDLARAIDVAVEAESWVLPPSFHRSRESRGTRR